MKPRKNEIIIDKSGEYHTIRLVSKGVAYIKGSSDVFFVKYLKKISYGTWMDT